MPHLVVDPAGLDIQAETGSNLLKVLRQHRVPIRYSCKRGQCGSCKCRLLQGRVELEGYEPGALPAAQREQGLILACCSRVGQDDLRIELVDADDYIAPAERDLQTRVTDLRELAPDLFAMRLGIVEADGGEPLVFAAGQYAELSVHGADGKVITRAFSIASTPVEAEYDGMLEFHIRRTPQGAFSSLLGSVIVPGSTIQVHAPLGSAHFRPRHSGPLLAVSAGTGLAPMLSIIRTALLNGKLEPVRLWAGFRNPDEVYGRAELAALKHEYPQFDYRIVVERDTPSGDVHGLVGDCALAELEHYVGAKFYLAGSPSMVEAVSAELLRRGVAAADVHADAFYAPPRVG